MIIDEKLLSKLERLSSIKICPNKRSEIMHQLSNIVSFVENLNELNLSGINAKVNTIDRGLIFRQDVPKNDKNVIEIVLKNNQNSDNGFFVVPKIIE